MDANRLYHLLDALAANTITIAEEVELTALTVGVDQETLAAAVGAHMQAQVVSAEQLAGAAVDEVHIRAIMNRILSVDQLELQKVTRPVHRVHFLKTTWFRYAAAIIILFGIGAYLWNTQQKEKSLITESKPAPVKNDIAPGSNRAVLTLSDGRKVELIPETSRIAESGINIENANGRLEYGKAEKVVFNTMSTPRGGQYQLTLPDGTNVWLNAASSITYPTAFVSDTREVTIIGEAYFEVQKNQLKPFVVKTPKQDITVLGTSFNVNVYPDEKVMKTSLLEGSVKVENIILKPGQAFINGKVESTNIQQDIAWKNGAFNFNDISVEAAFRQLARWYNVEIKYAGAIPSKKLRGKMGRDLTLAEVLKAFSGIGINTRIEGNTIMVLSK